MEDSGTANSARTRLPGGGAAQQEPTAAVPPGRDCPLRPAGTVAGGIIAVVCVALLVIIFFLDSFNATVYSVGGQDVRDATDQAKAIRDNYAGARAGGIVFLVLGVLAAAGGLVLYRHRNEAGSDDGDNGEDVDFEDLGGR